MVYHDTVSKSGTPTRWHIMTLLAKVAQPQTALRVFLFIFLLDINIFCTDAYISVQASHPDKTVCCMCARCIVICAQIP